MRKLNRTINFLIMWLITVMALTLAVLVLDWIICDRLPGQGTPVDTEFCIAICLLAGAITAIVYKWPSRSIR